MYHVNVWTFYRLGRLIRPLTEFKEGNTSKDISTTLFVAEFSIDHILGEVSLSQTKDSIPLSRCKPYGIRLRDNVAKLHKRLLENPGVGLSKTDLSSLKTYVDQFESALMHELEGMPFFFIPQKGTHSTQDLLEHAESNLPDNVRLRLTDETIKDIQQAGKCLALDAPTAVGFHLLRAVESLIRLYHAKVTGKALTVKSRNWGAYIRDLNNAGADQKVMGYLIHIKDYYRNPIVHPEVTLTTAEAFSLFGAALSAIVQLDAAIQAWP